MSAQRSKLSSVLSIVVDLLKITIIIISLALPCRHEDQDPENYTYTGSRGPWGCRAPPPRPILGTLGSFIAAGGSPCSPLASSPSRIAATASRAAPSLSTDSPCNWTVTTPSQAVAPGNDDAGTPPPAPQRAPSPPARVSSPKAKVAKVAPAAESNGQSPSPSPTKSATSTASARTPSSVACSAEGALGASHSVGASHSQNESSEGYPCQAATVLQQSLRFAFFQTTIGRQRA